MCILKYCTQYTHLVLLRIRVIQHVDFSVFISLEDFPYYCLTGSCFLSAALELPVLTLFLL